MLQTLKQPAPAATELTAAPAGPAPPPDGVRALPALDRSNMSAIFQLAVQLHQAGHAREAEPIYQRILAVDPDHINALHMLGVLCHQLGDDDRAVSYLNRATALNRSDASFFRHLGEVYRSLRRFDKAVESFRQSLALEPDDPDALCNLGHTYIQSGRFREAEVCYRRAVSLAPDDSEAHGCLGIALLHQDKRRRARAAFEKAIRIDPGTDEARHMLAALRGERVDAPPRDYVIGLFDRYADTFENHVKRELGYDVPQRLREAVRAVTAEENAAWRIADLGCGTGLCGAQFRGLASHLIGIDLSPRMIEHARKRSIYDDLLTGDLVEALHDRMAPLDLILAGDVFIYVGRLDRVIERCAELLRAGGLLAFSTERCGGRSFRLESSGRFAHSEAYVRRLAAAHGLDVIRGEDITVRIERKRPIAGQLFVLRRDGR